MGNLRSDYPPRVEESKAALLLPYDLYGCLSYAFFRVTRRRRYSMSISQVEADNISARISQLFDKVLAEYDFKKYPAEE